MTRVEEEYRKAIAGWTGCQRVERSEQLFVEVREMLVRRILARDPQLTSFEVNKRVAEQLYRSDPEALRLLSKLDS